MKKIVYIFLLVLALLSCDSTKTGDRRMITVTIEPLRYFTEQIAGDRFDVRVMVPRGSSPETYEPTARQMIDLSASDLYIKVGNIGFERAWMGKLKENARRMSVVDSSEGVTPVNSINGIADPHTWMSCANAVIMARNICRALVRIDSRDSVYLMRNLDKLVSTIRKTDKVVRTELAKKQCKAFLIYHPSLTYFAKEYGLTQIPIEEEGREPSAAQLRKVIIQAREKGVKTLFVQQEFANKNIQIIGKSTGATLETINPLGYDWNGEMIRIAKLMR